MKNLTILYVEDNEDIADFVQTYMDMEGHTVIVTLEEDKNFEYVEKKVVDIVLLDYVLPKINGMKILKEIRKKSDILVILLSGKKKDSIDKIMCIENGADDPQNPKYIKTIRGVGYMFCCDVTRR